MAAVNMNEKQFQEMLQGEKPVLVDFWAPWCGPCKMISPVVDQIAVELAGQAKVCKVNVDDDATRELCARFDIRSIPTLMFFRGGKLVDTVVGATSKENLVARLRACM